MWALPPRPIPTFAVLRSRVTRTPCGAGRGDQSSRLPSGCLAADREPQPRRGRGHQAQADRRVRRTRSQHHRGAPERGAQRRPRAGSSRPAPRLRRVRTLVLDGTLRVEHETGVIEVRADQVDPRQRWRVGAVLDALPRRRGVRRGTSRPSRPTRCTATTTARRERLTACRRASRRGAPRASATRRSTPSPTTTSSCARARRGCCPRATSSPSRTCRTLDELPEGDPAIVDAAVVPQAQRRPGHVDGNYQGQVLIEVKAGRASWTSWSGR